MSDDELLALLRDTGPRRVSDLTEYQRGLCDELHVRLRRWDNEKLMQLVDEPSCSATSDLPLCERAASDEFRNRLDPRNDEELIQFVDSTGCAKASALPLSKRIAFDLLRARFSFWTDCRLIQLIQSKECTHASYLPVCARASFEELLIRYEGQFRKHIEKNASERSSGVADLYEPIRRRVEEAFDDQKLWSLYLVNTYDTKKFPGNRFLAYAKTAIRNLAVTMAFHEYREFLIAPLNIPSLNPRRVSEHWLRMFLDELEPHKRLILSLVLGTLDLTYPDVIALARWAGTDPAGLLTRLSKAIADQCSNYEAHSDQLLTTVQNAYWQFKRAELELRRREQDWTHVTLPDLERARPEVARRYEVFQQAVARLDEPIRGLTRPEIADLIWPEQPANDDNADQADNERTRRKNLLDQMIRRLKCAVGQHSLAALETELAAHSDAGMRPMIGYLWWWMFNSAKRGCRPASSAHHPGLGIYTITGPAVPPDGAPTMKIGSSKDWEAYLACCCCSGPSGSLGVQ